MSRVRQFLDIDVVTAARQRVAQMFDLFDTVVVQFSGGKDSQVCVELVRQEAERRGELPVKVVFRDEEVLPDEVVEHVDWYRRQEWCDLRWYCVPTQTDKVILGRHADLIFWEPGREWVRPMPACAITLPEGDDRVFEERQMDRFLAEPYKGSIAFVTGIRAEESLTRYRSCVNKLNLNWVTKPLGWERGRVRLCKPIYDWSWRDVMKWLRAEASAPWCPEYDVQHAAGAQLRVATPLHAEGAKQEFGKGAMRRKHPELYERIRAIWPDIELEERYRRWFDARGIVKKYAARGWDGCEAYIQRAFATEPIARERALQRLHEMRTGSQRDPEGYRPEILMRALVNGAIKRVLLPQRKTP